MLAAGRISPAMLTLLVLALLAGFALFAEMIGRAYLLTPLARIVIFAIAALSLNLILGFGGMVSFGHALYVGIGVYAVGISDFFGLYSGWLHIAAALAASALIALMVGSLSLRVSGVYFIMITLAFSQMAYYLFTGLTVFGGDEGMSLAGRSQFLAALPLKDPLTFYFFCLTILALYALICHRIVQSRFGLVIDGARINERRMLALGFPVFRYRLVAYVISGSMCSIGSPTSTSSQARSTCIGSYRVTSSS
jgi:branched-chain amino acid transport system permease protein